MSHRTAAAAHREAQAAIRAAIEDPTPDTLWTASNRTYVAVLATRATGPFETYVGVVFAEKADYAASEAEVALDRGDAPDSEEVGEPLYRAARLSRLAAEFHEAKAEFAHLYAGGVV